MVQLKTTSPIIVYEGTFFVIFAFQVEVVWIILL